MTRRGFLSMLALLPAGVRGVGAAPSFSASPSPSAAVLPRSPLLLAMERAGLSPDTLRLSDVLERVRTGEIKQDQIRVYRSANT